MGHTEACLPDIYCEAVEISHSTHFYELFISSLVRFNLYFAVQLM